MISDGGLENNNMKSDEAIFCRNARYHCTAQYCNTMHCTEHHSTAQHCTSLTYNALTQLHCGITPWNPIDIHNSGEELLRCTSVYTYSVYIQCTYTVYT